jgi:hypothetical protein
MRVIFRCELADRDIAILQRSCGTITWATTYSLEILVDTINNILEKLTFDAYCTHISRNVLQVTFPHRDLKMLEYLLGEPVRKTHAVVCRSDDCCHKDRVLKTPLRLQVSVRIRDDYDRVFSDYESDNK